LEPSAFYYATKEKEKARQQVTEKVTRRDQYGQFICPDRRTKAKKEK